jgi:hypothetical protein
VCIARIDAAIITTGVGVRWGRDVTLLAGWFTWLCRLLSIRVLSGLVAALRGPRKGTRGAAGELQARAHELRVLNAQARATAATCGRHLCDALGGCPAAAAATRLPPCPALPA